MKNLLYLVLLLFSGSVMFAMESPESDDDITWSDAGSSGDDLTPQEKLEWFNGKEQPSELDDALQGLSENQIKELKPELQDILVKAAWELNQPLINSLVTKYRYAVDPNQRSSLNFPSELAILINKTALTLLFEIIIQTLWTIDQQKNVALKSFDEYAASEDYKVTVAIIKDLIQAGGTVPPGLFAILKARAQNHPAFNDLISYSEPSKPRGAS